MVVIKMKLMKRKKCKERISLIDETIKNLIAKGVEKTKTQEYHHHLNHADVICTTLCSCINLMQ